VSPPDGDPWVDAFPWLAATGAAVKVRKLLEQAEQAYRHSAIQLRAAGQPESAIRVERFAASARWALDEPAEYRRLMTSRAACTTPQGSRSWPTGSWPGHCR
jgi:hypothetical protein